MKKPALCFTKHGPGVLEIDHSPVVISPPEPMPTGRTFSRQVLILPADRCVGWEDWAFDYRGGHYAFTVWLEEPWASMQRMADEE